MKEIKLNIATLLLVVFTACQSDLKSTEEENKTFCLNETLKSEAVLESIQETEIVKHIKLSGEVDFDPNKIFHYSSLVEGFANRVLVSLGDYVKKGDLLAEIQSPELIAWMTEKYQLQAELGVAKRELSAIESMYNSGLNSERDFIQARAEVEKIQLEIESLSKKLSLFNYNSAKKSFEIRAVSNGYLIEKNLNSAMQINEGDHLFTISELDKVWVMANVYSHDIQHLSNGMKVSIEIPAYPGESFEGSISSIAPVFDKEERVLKAKIAIENPDFKLKPGMLALVTIEQKTGETAFSIPVDDVTFDANQNILLIYHSDCEIEIRPIQIYDRNESTYYVKEGVLAGEQLITKNQLLIYEELKNSMH